MSLISYVNPSLFVTWRGFPTKICKPAFGSFVSSIIKARVPKCEVTRSQVREGHPRIQLSTTNTESRVTLVTLPVNKGQRRNTKQNKK